MSYEFIFLTTLASAGGSGVLGILWTAVKIKMQNTCFADAVTFCDMFRMWFGLRRQEQQGCQIGNRSQGAVGGLSRNNGVAK